VRFDVPSRCADLLHAGEIDLGLIPSIEYLRGPVPHAIVPGLAIASRGPVASVALYTRREPRDVRSIAMDISSRTSVALVTVIFRVSTAWLRGPCPRRPMSRRCWRADAALIIGDNALLLDHQAAGIQKIDLGEVWTATTGLPFVYAFWAGRPGVLAPDGVVELRRAYQCGAADVSGISRAYFPDQAARQAIASSYLRDNIRYDLKPAEIEGLRAFYRFAAELGLASDGSLRFYDAED
jgi:chorismate dehydratase